MRCPEYNDIEHILIPESVLVIAAYLITVICCIVMHSELIDNPNRAGTFYNCCLSTSAGQVTLIIATSRVYGTCSIPCCLLIRDQELSPLSSSWPRSWLRKTELHPPMGWARNVHWCCRAWLSVDSQSLAVRFAYPWTAEGDFRSRIICATLRACFDILQANQTAFLSIFLHHPVSCLSTSYHACRIS